MMISLVIFTILSSLTTFIETKLECANRCRCTVDGMQCTRNTLPIGVPEYRVFKKLKLRQLKHVKNIANPLYASNFSNYAELRKLIIMNIAISSIDNRTFSEMKLLNLHIINCSLQRLEANTFAYLNLHNLELFNNVGIEIMDGAFNNLVVSVLSLNHCGLTKLTSKMFNGVEIKNSLLLKNNKLTTINKSLEKFLSNIPNVSMGENVGLICSCKLIWLQNVYKKKVKMVEWKESNRRYIVPHCSFGSNDHYIDYVNFTSKCHVIEFRRIILNINTHGGELNCAAKSYYPLNVFWVTPDGESIIVSDRQVMYVSRSRPGIYTCVASNNFRRMQFSLNLTWNSPQSATTQQRISTSTSSLSLPASFVSTSTPPSKPPTQDRILPGKFYVAGDSSTPRLTAAGHGPQRRYSLNQLIAAVLGTHIATLAICACVVALCVRSRPGDKLRDKKRNSEERDSLSGHDYSERPTPDDFGHAPYDNARHADKKAAMSMPRELPSGGVYLNDISMRRMDYVIANQ